MKLCVMMAAAAIAVVAIAMKVSGEEAKSDEKAPATTQTSTQPTTQAAGKIVNKKCPVGGEDVDPKGKTVVYKGKTIGFCCDDCIKDFEKDPEKYAKNLK